MLLLVIPIISVISMTVIIVVMVMNFIIYINMKDEDREIAKLFFFNLVKE